MRDMVLGLSTEDLLKIKEKLAVIGVEIKDIITFLDRDKVQLFAEQQRQIVALQQKLEAIKNVINSEEK